MCSLIRDARSILFQTSCLVNQVVLNNVNVFCRQTTVLFGVLNDATEFRFHHLHREKHRGLPTRMLAHQNNFVRLVFSTLL